MAVSGQRRNEGAPHEPLSRTGVNLLTVLGARPQFIKAAPVSAALRTAGHDEAILHTGQHYDDAMSRVFFEEMDIPRPVANLGVGSGRHGAQTARMLIGIEEALQARPPDVVLVYGDTNSTLAGALAACKLGLPLAHVEAGLRSFNRSMPEEHNRVIADHCADLLCCPTQTAVDNLAREGVTEGVHLVGDTMVDALHRFLPVARSRSRVLEDLGLAPREYALATVHRAYNTDDTARLRAILDALGKLALPTVLPLHPRTRARMEATGVRAPREPRIIEPTGYLDTLMLLSNAQRLFTDSGGMQKEAYVLGVPCVTLRPETEWVETVAAGWNILVDADPERIRAAAAMPIPTEERAQLFGDGHAAERIVRCLETI
jgi:UDP-N-acetylglucosamine 2-epimerase